jgi:hypothetical protein
MTPSGKIDRPSDLRTRSVPEPIVDVLQMPIAPRRVDIRKEWESQRLLMELRAWSLFALAVLGLLAAAIAFWLV